MLVAWRCTSVVDNKKCVYRTNVSQGHHVMLSLTTSHLISEPIESRIDAGILCLEYHVAGKFDPGSIFSGAKTVLDLQVSRREWQLQQKSGILHRLRIIRAS